MAGAEGQGGNDADAESFADHRQEGGHVGDPAGRGERSAVLIVQSADGGLAAAGRHEEWLPGKAGHGDVLSAGEPVPGGEDGQHLVFG
jgi:hypothetical protein